MDAARTCGRKADVAAHEPVLLAATLEFLRNGPGLYLDATVGDGGHAHALLAAEPGARLLAADRDPDALATAHARLAPFEDRVSWAHATFAELPPAHRALGGEPLTGALFDFGLSSRQIDQPARGISFTHDGPLDLRMDATRGEPAAARLARASETEIADALRSYGDVGPAPRLARAIVRAAQHGALATTRQLAELVDRAWGGRPHPRQRARVFQALRMWINDEPREIAAAMEWLPGAVRAGGVVVTLAYHSGEDRIIKQALRAHRVPGSRRLPEPQHGRPMEGPWEELTRKVVVPSDEEIARNPRARSARLRAFRRRTS